MAIEIISQSINDFRTKYPQFEYGIASMEGLYDVLPNPEEAYKEMDQHTHGLLAILMAEDLVGGACEISKSLSIYHADNPAYGYIMIGLYSLKSFLWILDTWTSNHVKHSVANSIHAFQANPIMNSHFNELSSQVADINYAPVVRISNCVIEIAKNRDLSEEDKQKFDRLIALNRQLKGTQSVSRYFYGGLKILSLLAGLASGISVAISGQDSLPSYYLTLSAGGLESSLDSAFLNMTQKPSIQKYTTISEVLFLCDHFLEQYRTNESYTDGIA